MSAKHAGVTRIADQAEAVRHLLILERYPGRDAVLTVNGKAARIIRLKVTPDVTEILYEEERP